MSPKSVNKEAYKTFSSEVSDIHKTKGNEILGTHFDLGFSEKDHKTSQSSYGENVHNSVKTIMDPNEHKKTKFTLGNNQKKWASVYDSNYFSNKTNPYMRALKTDHISDINLGVWNEKSKSVMNTSYVRIAGRRNELDPDTASYIKKRHFSLGNQKPQYDLSSSKYGDWRIN